MCKPPSYTKGYPSYVVVLAYETCLELRGIDQLVVLCISAFSLGIVALLHAHVFYPN
jgi:hypothetical protein